MLCHTARFSYMKTTTQKAIALAAISGVGLFAAPKVVRAVSAFAMVDASADFCRGKMRKTSTGEHWWYIDECGSTNPVLPEGFTLHTVATEPWPHFAMGLNGSSVEVELTSSTTLTFPLSNKLLHELHNAQEGIYHDHLFTAAGSTTYHAHFLYKREWEGLEVFVYKANPVGE